MRCFFFYPATEAGLQKKALQYLVSFERRSTVFNVKFSDSSKLASPFWLHGIMVCDKCGSRMVGNSVSTRSKSGGQRYSLVADI